jgi:RNA polymerase sigma factor (sigma-70 family)
VRESSAELDAALDRARTGDTRAFDALFRAYGSSVVGYLRARRVSDPDDLANEVFVRAFRNIHTVRGDSSRFRSWLFGIAHNAALDDARRRRRRPRETTLEPWHMRVGGDAESDAISELERESVHEMIDELAPDQRDVLLLRVVGDLSVAQTAAVLDKSYEAVKALQRRGLGALRRKIEAATGVPR